jgi:hypothetical protein
MQSSVGKRETSAKNDIDLTDGSAAAAAADGALADEDTQIRTKIADNIEYLDMAVLEEAVMTIAAHVQTNLFPFHLKRQGSNFVQQRPDCASKTSHFLKHSHKPPSTCRYCLRLQTQLRLHPSHTHTPSHTPRQPRAQQVPVAWNRRVTQLQHCSRRVRGRRRGEHAVRKQLCAWAPPPEHRQREENHGIG